MKHLMRVFVVAMFVLGVSVGLSQETGADSSGAGKAGTKQSKKLSAEAAAAAESSVPSYLSQAVNNTKRPEEDRKRDKFRRPQDVLHFFGIKPGMRVAEMMAGRGYYVELLSRLIGSSGKVYAHNNKFVMKRFAEKALQQRLSGNRLPNVVQLTSELDQPRLPSNLDAVLMILFYHDTFWMKADRKKMNQAIFDALKPGGLYGVIDHYAKLGAGGSVAKTLHRVDIEQVKQDILKAGFVLEGESGLLRNYQDDHTVNVFRPEIRGRTDRFILLFRKPLPKKKPTTR